MTVDTSFLQLEETMKAIETLTKDFHIRSALFQMARAWNLELVRSDGLAAATISMRLLAEDRDDVS